MTPIEQFNWHDGKFYSLGLEKEFFPIEGGVVLVAKRDSKNTIQIAGASDIARPKSFGQGEEIAKNVVCIEGKVQLSNDPDGDLPILTLAEGATIEAKPLIGYKNIRFIYKPANSKNVL
jgi:hypothetical protein